MTEKQKKQILNMREKGFGYKTIASTVGLSRDIVRTFCKKRNMTGFGKVFALNVEEKVNVYKRCLNCFSQIRQPTRGRRKKFCSEKCRREWWKQHPEKINRRETAYYHLKCVCCGREFISYGNKKRKYCSHYCYIYDRFYGRGGAE